MTKSTYADGKNRIGAFRYGRNRWSMERAALWGRVRKQKESGRPRRMEKLLQFRRIAAIPCGGVCRYMKTISEIYGLCVAAASRCKRTPLIRLSA